MEPLFLAILILLYFGILLIISWITGKKTDNSTFFIGNRQSPWMVVAFGMIGASLSGVTFMSVPGEVGHSNFSYMQFVFGYLAGYIVIANLLMPLYYRLKLISIYEYLNSRFGRFSYKTGSVFFIISRVIGSAIRLYLVAIVFDKFILSQWGVPFWLTVAITIFFIWIYSFRAGVKTIIWTDTIQAFFMLAALVFSIVFIAKEMDLSLHDLFEKISQSRYSHIFVWEWKPQNNFFKYFFSGAFITIVMTGLDQDMMQKNLSCKNIKDAKKNMYTMTTILICVNFLFLLLGAALYLYASSKSIIIENFAIHNIPSDCRIELFNQASGQFECASTDQLFPVLSIKFMPYIAGLVFAIGLIAAAYSTADSALTSLTTSFCIDFLGFKTDNTKIKTRYLVHIGFSILLFFVIILFKMLNNDSVINNVFTVAGYTYGPLLGMYAFGLFTKYNVKDKLVPVVAVLSPVISYLIYRFADKIIPGYKIGFELLIINGCLAFLGLLLIIKRKKNV